MNQPTTSSTPPPISVIPAISATASTVSTSSSATYATTTTPSMLVTLESVSSATTPKTTSSTCQTYNAKVVTSINVSSVPLSSPVPNVITLLTTSSTNPLSSVNCVLWKDVSSVLLYILVHNVTMTMVSITPFVVDVTRVVLAMVTLHLGLVRLVAVSVEMDGLCWRKSVMTTTLNPTMAVRPTVEWNLISSVSMNPVTVPSSAFSPVPTYSQKGMAATTSHSPSPSNPPFPSSTNTTTSPP